jgi:ribosomal subunit interface protein
MRKYYRGLPMIWQTSPGWDVPSQFRSFKRPTLAQPWRRRNVVFKTAKQQMVTSMQIPAEIAFHNIESSDSIEDAIHAHIARLERIYDRMTTCRVRVDQRNQNANGTIPPVVHIEISVPGGGDIVVAHEAGHLQRKFQAPDLRNAINEAFRIAEQRLAKYKDKLTDRSAAQTHEAAQEFTGQIAEMTPDKDFGFLMTKEGALLYFHRNSVLAGDFDKLKRGDDVTYVEGMGDTGPIATKVRG